MNYVHPIPRQTFREINLFELASCFLDPQGKFILGGKQVGVHEELAYEIIKEDFGEDEDPYHGRGYAYQWLEEEVGYWRYSHWVGDFGVWNGEKDKMTHAQKIAIKEFCRANDCTWEQVVRY